MAKSPILSIGKTAIEDIEEYREPFMEMLSQVLDDIYNRQLAFEPTQDRTRCATCPYKQLCSL